MGTNSSNKDTTMSFINLMSNDVWSDADILRRTESMIRAEFSLDEETILNRKALGKALGTYEPTEEEQYELVRYTAVAENARVEYQAAVADMNLLKEVFVYEDASRVLNEMTLADAQAFIETPRPEEVLDEEGNVTNQDELNAYDTSYNEAQQVISKYESIEQNESARASAQQVIDNSSQDVKDLFLLRNPEE